MTEDQEIYLEQKLSEFFAQVGVIDDHLELTALGLEIDSVSAMFFSESLSRLELFCHLHPSFHIVSFCRDRAVNKALPAARYYFLADGAANPHLFALLPPLNRRSCQRSLNALVARVGLHPADPVDRFELQLLRQLAFGNHSKE